MSTLWNTSPTPTFSANGQFASGAQVFFYLGGTSSPLVVYGDAAFAQALPVPVIADQNGVFPPIFIPYGAYRRRVVDQNGVLISDADNIDNLAPVVSGGPGLGVTIDQIIQTGDMVPRLRTGVMQGFVRMNGGTIGSLLSGATELAGPTANALFAYNWNNFPDTICPVSGGRGGSASADLASNKRIGLISMRGVVFAGLDDMGATAGGIIQAVTTCTTNGTTTVVVVTAANIAVGDIAIVNGINLGAVVSISGTTIVLANAAAGTASGITFRSSRFADAQVAGNTAGVANFAQTADTLPSHGHTLTDSGHGHTYNSSSNGPNVAGGVIQAANTIFGDFTSLATTGITINNAGAGNPLSILQPTVIGTWYQKL